MRLKTNLHFHTGDDPRDFVFYTTEEGIDHAAMLGFDVLAITCHEKAAWTAEYAAYAAKKGILLIPGIELDIHESDGSTSRNGRHVIILNCVPEVARVRTFSELKEYRALHPECLVLAPHPFFYGNFSLKRFLEDHIDLIDAIEHSWFYGFGLNRNKKAGAVAEAHHLPFIATSDAHTFQNVHSDYAIVDAEEKTIPALFAAIRKQKIRNITCPKKIVRGMIIPVVKLLAQNFLYRRGRK